MDESASGSESPILSEGKKKLEESAIVGDTTFFYSLTRQQFLKATKYRDINGRSLLHLAVVNGQTEVRW
ncbi:hypothetical protein BVRB_3g058100 isoform B [Beta vulgaris subsp. vulgaris]|nr:hypothetical protein BVRB_3g058100 isoform B [Beta vulgaris subsp. vulgaris]